MTSLVFDKARVAPWVAEKIGKSGEWGMHEAFGLERNGELIGGVVIDDYVANVRCSIHCAGVGRRWLNREFLWVVFDYVFNQLTCKVVVNTVASNNEPSLRFTEHLGFTRMCVIPDGFIDSDMVILALRKKDCRWLDLKARTL